MSTTDAVTGPNGSIIPRTLTGGFVSVVMLLWFLVLLTDAYAWVLSIPPIEGTISTLPMTAGVLLFLAGIGFVIFSSIILAFIIGTIAEGVVWE